MARVSDTYTGQFLSAGELTLGQRRHAVIHAAVAEVVGPDASAQPRIVLDLVAKNGTPWPRRLVLNKGNANALAAAYGDDCDHWPGKAITVWTEMVMFKGKSVPGVKVSADSAPALAQPTKGGGADWAGPGSELDDEIPF
jgi:hypothetical protein